MKISIFIVVIVVIILTALSAAGFFIYQNLISSEVKKEEAPLVGIGGEEIKTEEVLKETRLLKDDFEITLPPGWQETTSTPEGFLLLAFDAEEDISGGNFQKLDFRTNLSIKSDDLGKYSSLDTLEKYVESMKISLVQMVPGIKFTREEGNILECESTQAGVDFKTLLVFIEGSDKVVYAISLNAFQSSWADYKDVFEQIAQSFKLRYSI